MKTRKLLLKSAYCFTGLFILLSVGLNIYQYQQIKVLSERPVSVEIIKNEPVNDSKPAPFKTVQERKIKGAASVNKEKLANTNDIDELEYQLNASEEELDLAYEKLTDELLKKAEYKNTMNEYLKNKLTDPSSKQMKKEVLTLTLGKAYDPLLKKMNLSQEKFDEFKDMLVDQMMEIESMKGTLLTDASSTAEKTDAIRNEMEIKERYNNMISDFLGTENNEIYRTYVIRLTERMKLNEFLETLPPDNRINEEQAEDIINSMYKARKTVYREMISGENMDSTSDLTRENLTNIMEMTARVNEKYLNVCNGALTPNQMEQFKEFLDKRIAMDESRMKMNLYLHDIN